MLRCLQDFWCCCGSPWPGLALGAQTLFADAWPLVLVCTALSATALIVTRVARRRQSCAADGTPIEVRDDFLAYAERHFRSKGDNPIVARVDRGFRRHDGTITLVELKAREVVRIYPSDIIELSAQRLALEGSTGEQVDPDGIIVVQLGPRHHAHRVRLMSQRAILDLAMRRARLLDGDVVPRPTSSRRLCAKCAYRGRCHPKA